VPGWGSGGTRGTGSPAWRSHLRTVGATPTGGRSRSRSSPGELHDDKTLPSQVVKLKDRFGLSEWCGRGSRDGHQGKHRVAQGGRRVDWITALKAPTIKKLARSGVFQPSLFDEQNLGRSPTSPSSRRTTGRVPQPAGRRAARRKRSELLRQPRLISLRSLTVSPPDADRRRPDRSRDRSGAEALPDAQALPDHDH